MKRSIKLNSNKNVWRGSKRFSPSTIKSLLTHAMIEYAAEVMAPRPGDTVKFACERFHKRFYRGRYL